MRCRATHAWNMTDATDIAKSFCKVYTLSLSRMSSAAVGLFIALREHTDATYQTPSFTYSRSARIFGWGDTLCGPCGALIQRQ